MSNEINDDSGLDSLPPVEPQPQEDAKTVGGSQVGDQIDLEEPQAQEQQAQSKDDYYQPNVVNEHVTMEGKSPFVERPAGRTREEPMFLLNTDLKDLTNLLNEYQIDFTDEWVAQATPEQLRIQQICSALMGKISLHYYENLAHREGSSWVQAVPSAAGPIRAGLPGVSSSDDTSLKVGDQIGTQRLIQIPLWHSGIWVTLRSPNLSKLVELDERLSQEKSMLGRQSNGMVFSSTEVYANYHIMEFILDHVHSSTLPNKRRELFKETVRVTDMSQLMWGMCVAMYPKGYPLTQPCLANPNKCNHTFEALLNLGKITWTDHSMLSPEQVRHMENRTKVMDLAKVREYQEAFVWKGDRVIPLPGNVSLRLAVPSIAEAENSGFAWVDGIYKATAAAFGVKLEGMARDNYVNRQVMASTLRQYSHWIDAIVRVNDEGQEQIEDGAEDLDTTLEDLCIDSEVVDTVTTGILNFIDTTTLTLIAIPKQPCPKCGKEVDSALLRHPELIPLDVVNLFFTLRFLKTRS